MKISKADLDDLYSNQKSKPQKPNKYGAKKTTVNGIKFDSKKEGLRYMVLRNELKIGQIVDLELQPEFVLQDKFKCEGKTIRAIKYRGDFRYYRDGVDIVEDVKGMKTAVYQIKKKLFMKRYPSIKFVET